MLFAFFLILVCGAAAFYIFASRRDRLTLQRDASRLLEKTSSSVPNFREQAYLDWIELGQSTRAIEPIPLAEEAIKSFVVCRHVDEVPPATALKDVAKRLYASEFKLIVVNNGEVIGTISRSDIGKALERAEAQGRTVADLLHFTTAKDVARTDYQFADVRQTVHSVVQLMNDENKIALVVLDEEKRPFGIVARTHLAARLRRRLFELTES
jgi:CBS domain-containing protein